MHNEKGDGKMAQGSELVKAVKQAASEVDGTKKISCAMAFEVGERFGATKMEVGQICNDEGIRIFACQLGCFK